MVGINLDGFSLANRLQFAKFAKLSPRQTFPLYGMLFIYRESIIVKNSNLMYHCNQYNIKQFNIKYLAMCACAPNF